MSNLQTNHHFKRGPAYRGTWLIHGTKHRDGNELQTLNSSVEYPSR